MRTTLNPRTFKKTPLSSCFIVQPTASFACWVCSPDHTAGIGSLSISFGPFLPYIIPFTSHIKEVKSVKGDRWWPQCIITLMRGAVSEFWWAEGHISPLSLKTKQLPTWQRARTGTQPVFKLSQENGVAGVDPGERHSAPDSPSLSQAYEGVFNF